MAIQVTEKLARVGTACRPGLFLKPTYITIHNTANEKTGAGALNHANYLLGGGANSAVSWHLVVDDKDIYRCIPEHEVAWHAGDGANGIGNRNSLAIEICENPESNLQVATDKAAELTAYLMKDYGIPISHIVQHNRWSGKDCPRRIRKGEPYSWGTFISKVEAYFRALTAPQAGGSDEVENGWVLRKYNPVKAFTSEYAAAPTLAEEQKIEPKAFMQYSNGKYRVYKPTAASTSKSSAELFDKDPDAIVRFEKR